MPYETKRDQVWTRVVEEFLSAESPTLSTHPDYIAEETGVSERTARDTLKAMAERGLVEEDRIPNGRVVYKRAGVFDEAGFDT